MKHLKIYIGMIAAMLAVLTSCSDSLVNDSPSDDAAEDSYTASINIAIPSYNKNTTRSITFGLNEGIEKAEDMLLFCFDNEGQFVGFGKITYFENVALDKTDMQGKTEKGGDIHADGSTDTKQIKVVLPNATSRIHFVANANSQYKTVKLEEQANWQGMHENILMTTFETQYGENQAQMTRYWGYVKKDSPAELKKFLEEKTKDYIVHLVRDRAKISAKWSDEYKKSHPGQEDSDIKISVINGQAYGTLAPFDRNKLVFPTTTGDENWVWDIDYITPSLSADRLKGDNGQSMNPSYTFENRNLPTDPMKVILNINGKFYFIFLQDENNIPYIIKRNYEYKIVIDKLDEDWGWGNSEDALKSAPVNNPWIKVKEIVPNVSDGKYTLGIVNETHQMLNEGKGEQTVQFTYQGDASLTADNFYVSWIKNEQYAEASQPKVSSYTYDAKTGIGSGTITYQLKEVDKNLKSGIIHLIDKKHGLNRDFYLYSLSEGFDFKAPESMGRDANSTGEITLNIPDNFPDEMLPIKIKIASNDVVMKNCPIDNIATKVETGETMNKWSVYTINKKGKHTLTLTNLRNASAGSTGRFYVKADNFNHGKAYTYTFKY